MGSRARPTRILFPHVSRMDSVASSLIGWKALCCKQVERDNETKAKIPHVSVDWSVDVQQWSKENAKESAFKEPGLEVTRCSLPTLRKFWLHISRYSLHCLGFRLANGDNNGLKVLCWVGGYLHEKFGHFLNPFGTGIWWKCFKYKQLTIQIVCLCEP